MKDYRQPKFSEKTIFAALKSLTRFFLLGIALGILGMLLILFLDNSFTGLGLIGLGIISILMALMFRYELGNDEILMRLDELIKIKQEKK